VRFVTWNIHGCVGADARFDPQRIAGVLQRLDAEVVALQEVEASRFGGEDVLAFLAARTGTTAIAGPTMRRRDADYGNALLTRLPVQRVDRLDLSVPGAEPRGLIDVRLGDETHALRVLTTHLGLRAAERQVQTDRLLAQLARDTLPRVALLGDFNAWWPWSRTLRAVDRRFPLSIAPRTFPARMPLFRLDRIWLLGHDGPVQGGCLRDAHARQASDHLPVWLDARWRNDHRLATGGSAAAAPD
jgi:endonuclease/exonuclease/phosphatase family metal-dependent hydrolase